MNRDERAALEALMEAAKKVNTEATESDDDVAVLTAEDMRRRNGLANGRPVQSPNR